MAGATLQCGRCRDVLEGHGVDGVEGSDARGASIADDLSAVCPARCRKCPDILASARGPY
ncbi:hypothetical protein XAP6164_3020038 [Xanthomonas phaseoli pv. phaseoli]|nr:hypothetical protein XAP6164_3020038 [Xanthomonas phaseoli pv. phaseoli]